MGPYAHILIHIIRLTYGSVKHDGVPVQVEFERASDIDTGLFAMGRRVQQELRVFNERTLRADFGPKRR